MIVHVFLNHKLNTSLTFTAEEYVDYVGTKIANTTTGTLNHYTKTSVTNPASPSKDVPSNSTTEFVYNDTSFESGCVDGDGNSGLITIQGHAYMQDLIENPGLTYTMASTMASNLTIAITDT